MIIGAILWLVSWIVSIIAHLLPQLLLPAYVLEPIKELIAAALKFDGLIPVQTILQCLTFIIAFEIGMFVLKIVIGIFNYVRGTGSIELD